VRHFWLLESKHQPHPDCAAQVPQFEFGAQGSGQTGWKALQPVAAELPIVLQVVVVGHQPQLLWAVQAAQEVGAVGELQGSGHVCGTSQVQVEGLLKSEQVTVPEPLKQHAQVVPLNGHKEPTAGGTAQ